MPGVFPGVERDGKYLLDGGLVWRSDMQDAVRWCRDEGYPDEEIVIDWVMCAETHLVEEEDLSTWHAAKHYVRAGEISDYYKFMQDVERTKLFFPDINYRYIIGPSESLATSPIPLDFSRDHLDHCIAVGQKDAANAIKLGARGYSEVMLQQYHALSEG